MADGGTDNYGLNQHYKYFEIELDSLDASVATTQGYTSMDWPTFQLATPVAGLAAVKILEVQIPFSFYTINSSNNTFTLTDTTPLTNVVITIPAGNYNTTTLISTLTTQLNAAGSAGVYSITYSATTGLFTFVKTGAATFTFTFGTSTDLGSTNPRFNLGFNAGANTTASNTLTAPNVALVTGPNYLYLNSRTFGAQLSLLLPRGATQLGSGAAGPQVARIPINVQPGGVIYWSDPDPQKWFTFEDLPLLPQFDFYITVGNNATPAVTTLNGLGFSVKLGLLQNQKLTSTLQGSYNGMPASTVIGGNKRMRY
jgi:hypothetical protein